jgi:hypothetical protein
MHAARERLPASASARVPPSPSAVSFSRSGDFAEREADRLADAAFRHPAFRDTTLDAADSGLGSRERAGFERALGFDFSRVRLFADRDADRSAREAGALAFTVGDRIFWGARVRPGSARGRRILAHELAHIAAGHTAASPHTAFRLEAPTATLPTEEQQQAVQDILNPKAPKDEPETEDAQRYINEITPIGDKLREERLDQAKNLAGEGVSMSEKDLTDVALIAEEEVRRVAPSRATEARVALNRIRYIPTDPGTKPSAGEAKLTEDELKSLDLGAVRIALATSSAAQEKMTKYNVKPSGDLHTRALRAIVNKAPKKWRTIALGFRGWNLARATMVQRRILPEQSESAEQTRGRGRWLNLGTAIHEILHAITHRWFSEAVRELSRPDLTVEGFTEFFTRPIYAALVSRARDDGVLRGRIQGRADLGLTPPPREAYEDFFKAVTKIHHHLGENLQNMREAYLNGRVEFIGLGPWNMMARGLTLAGANVIGAAFLVQAGLGASRTGRRLTRLSYGRLVFGYSGGTRLDLREDGVRYLVEGQRISVGPETTLTLRHSHLYLSGDALLEGSGATGGPSTPGLEPVLRLDAGARLGWLHVGPDYTVLIPITVQDAAQRVTRTYHSLGVSFVVGIW